jgi:hypothetical protein
MGCSRSLELWPCLTTCPAKSTKGSDVSTIMHDQVSFAMLHRLSALSSGDKSMFSSGTLGILSANQKSARAAGQECDSRLGDTEVRNCPLRALQAVARPSERRAALTSTAKGAVAELTRCMEARFRCKGLTEFAWLNRRRC